MSEAVASLGKKALAVVVLVVAAYLLFKLVIGLITSLAVFIVAAIAVVAVIWAVRTL
jgi:hypothetical protein